MNNDRHTILPHASRQRTERQGAKRWLAAWARDDEAILRFAVCIAVAWVALPEIHRLFGGMEHTFTVLRLGVLGPAHYALPCITHLIGGVL